MKVMVMMKLPLVIILLFVLTGIGMMFAMGNLWWCGLLAIGAGILLFAIGFREVPASPPHIGLVTIWGKRYPVVLTEGWYLVAPYFPLLYDFLKIGIERINKEFIFKNIRTRLEETKEKKDRAAGGEITVTIGLTYIPDYVGPNPGERLIEYINSGGQEGVENIIRGLIEGILRQFGGELTWEEYTFAGQDVKRRIVKELTGEDPPGWEEELKGGYPDIKHLGIRIIRLTVQEIKEQGKLTENAEAPAIEVQQRRAEEIEMDFVRNAVDALIKLGIPPETAIEIVQTERNKIVKNVNVIKISDLPEIAKVIGKLLLMSKKIKQ